MATPEQGCIVIAKVLDPQKRNSKSRPVIIITPTEQIKTTEPFYAVAITGQLPHPLTGDFVLIPYHRDGHVRTGLKKRSAAKCDWLVEIRGEDIERYLGRVPDAALIKIKERVKKLAED